MQTIGNPLEGETLSLYFHIPFCTRKCDYCHFYVLPDREDLKKQLMEGFGLEWKLREQLYHKKSISTVYFGGGTPALLGPDRIGQLIHWTQAPADAEITLEANPENVTLELMRAYANTGVNRVSIGLQALNQPLLHTLGRLHSAGKALESVELTAKAGIDNLSIDLMYDLPNQSFQDWKETLKRALELPITHLSLYNLTIEPHTLFHKKRSTLTPLLPDPEASLAMLEYAVEKLADKGLQRYEISAFAKPGFEAKHNSGYWTAHPFLGFGPSAFSYIQKRRFRNIANLSRYVEQLRANKDPVDFSEQLSSEESYRELLAIHLRLLAGVDLQVFNAQHGNFDLTYEITKLLDQGWLEVKNNRLRLTSKGTLFYDSVATELVGSFED